VFQLFVTGCLVWTTASSLWHFPHSLSYFHEFAGGPDNGAAHLIDSNLDWGQDLFFLKKWCDEHPEARPLYLAYFGGFDPKAAGIDYQPFSKGPSQAGTYVVSLSLFRGYAAAVPGGSGKTDEFQQSFSQPSMRRQGRIGYSMLVFQKGD
jgi:hypothetical protein